MPSFSLPFSNTLLLEFSSATTVGLGWKFAKVHEKSAMFAKDKLNFEEICSFHHLTFKVIQEQD